MPTYLSICQDTLKEQCPDDEALKAFSEGCYLSEKKLKNIRDGDTPANITVEEIEWIFLTAGVEVIFKKIKPGHNKKYVEP